MIEIYENCLNPIVTYKNKVYPCGQCELCKSYKSSEWTVRAYHELIMVKKALFITLTYHTDNLLFCDKNLFKPQAEGDVGGNLCPDDMKYFIKRLRKIFDKKKIKIKYLYCGEYGTLKKRPHYHCILYGIDINTITKFMSNKELKEYGRINFNSDYIKSFAEQTFRNIWNHGHVDVDTKGFVNEKIIKYILGYVRKKIYQNNELYTEIGRLKPFQRQSQGLGLDWCMKYMDQWTETLTVNIDGNKRAVPRYYIKKMHELEGKKYRYESKIKRISDKEVKETYNKYNYKVIKNRKAKYTKKVEDISYMKMVRNKDEKAKRLKDSNIDIDRIFESKIDEMKLYNNVNDQLYELSEIKNDYEMQELLHKDYTIVKCLNDPIDVDRSLLPLNDEMKLKRSAFIKKLERQSSPFGNRDKVD